MISCKKRSGRSEAERAGCRVLFGSQGVRVRVKEGVGFAGRMEGVV